MVDDSTYYGRAEVQTLLGIGDDFRQKLDRLQLLRAIQQGRYILYPKPYIDGLATLNRIASASGQTTRDNALFALYDLSDRFRGETCNTRVELQATRRHIREECEHLAIQAEIVRLRDASQHLKNIASQTTIYEWSRRGKLPVVKIGRTGFLSTSYVNHLRDIIAHWLNLDEAAYLEGVTPRTLRKWHLQGRTRSVVTPDGIIRFDPGQIKPARQKGWMTAGTLADYLGVPAATVNQAITLGIIPCKSIRGRRYVTQQVADEWLTRFTTINPTFVWLDEQLRQHPGSMLSIKHTARKLHIDCSTVIRWCDADVLPYYCRTFSRADGATGRVIPADYITGLIAHVVSDGIALPIRRATARKYRDEITPSASDS